MNIIIRQEQEEDYKITEYVVEEAFKVAEYADHTEQFLVAKLRIVMPLYQNFPSGRM